jgi:FAD/FMN-containing dehydrogenase
MARQPSHAAPSRDTVDAFMRIVGEGHAVRGAEAMAPYLEEWRDRYHGKAALVLKPGDTEQVAAILKLANETKTAIVPQGGNTGLVGGQIPFEKGHEVVVSLARLERVRDIDLASNTMTVEAGLVLALAQQVAETAGRLFPLSLASEGSAQIGGVLATNAGGISVLAYGSARDLTLGLEVVLADGRVWNGLKSLRKDNSGYDLKDLFVGSEGTLGIITAAVLRLFPKVAERVTCMAGLSALETAPAFFARTFERAGPALTAFEIMPRIGVEFVLKHGSAVRDPFPSPHAWYALFDLASPREGEELRGVAETVLGEALAAGEIDAAVVASSLAQGEELWRLRTLMSEVQKLEGGSIKHDVAVPVAAVPEFVARADQLVELMIAGARPVPFGHLGDGNIHYNVSQPPGMDRAIFLSYWEALNAAVHEIVLDLGGSISAEHGIGRLKRDLLPHAKQAVELELMRKIKAAFDPNNILNPGKLLR